MAGERKFNTAEDFSPPILEQREPVRAPSIHSDVLVPVYSALAFGGVVGLLMVLLGLAFDWQLEPRSWALLFAVPAVVVVVVVLYTQFGWAQSTLWRTEERSGQDLNRDGFVGPPPTFTTVNRWRKNERPVSETDAWKARFMAFVGDCYHKRTSTPALRNAGYSESEIEEFRGILMRQDVGAARWRNPRNPQLGWRMVRTEAETLAIIERGYFHRPEPAAKK